MSIEIRPELLDTDDEQWFVCSGEVPMMTCSGGTTGAMFAIAGIIRPQELLDDAGYADPKPARLLVEGALRGGILGPSMRQALGEFLGIIEWAIKHERRIEWA